MPRRFIFSVQAGRGGAEYDPGATLTIGGANAAELGLGVTANAQQYALEDATMAAASPARRRIRASMATCCSAASPTRPGCTRWRTSISSTSCASLARPNCRQPTCVRSITRPPPIWPAASILLIDIPESTATLDGMQTWLAQNDSLRSRNAAVYFRARSCRSGQCQPAEEHRRVAARSPASMRGPTPSAACGRRRPAPTRGCATSRRSSTSSPTARTARSTRSASTACAPSRSTATSAGARARSTAPICAQRVEVHPDPPARAVPRGEPVPRHEVGGVRAERRAAVGADPPERRRVHDGLFRQGAFQGTHAAGGLLRQVRQAETTTQADRNLGIVNIEVGFAPLKPAEFVVLKHPADAGDLQT